MDSALQSQTSTSLLGKLRHDPADQVAWKEFVRRYGPRIYRWCRQWNLQESDAHDVTQNVLLILVKEMQTFDYDPTLRFRSWLKTVTQHAWYRFAEKRQKPGVGSGDSQVMQSLLQVEARDELIKQIEEAFDRELLEEAMSRVKARVAPHTWDAFRLTALDGQSGAEAAAQLNMKVASVFVARGRVQKMLQEEIAQLEANIMR